MGVIHPILAQAGIGDTSSWEIFVVLAIWPFHIHTAIAGPPELVGYGVAAVSAQVILLFSLLAIFPFIIRSPRFHWSFKIIYLALGYPLVMLATNILPALIHDALL